jgi:hypothetical protein
MRGQTDADGLATKQLKHLRGRHLSRSGGGSGEQYLGLGDNLGRRGVRKWATDVTVGREDAIKMGSV